VWKSEKRIPALQRKSKQPKKKEAAKEEGSNQRRRKQPKKKEATKKEGSNQRRRKQPKKKEATKEEGSNSKKSETIQKRMKQLNFRHCFFLSFSFLFFQWWVVSAFLILSVF